MEKAIASISTALQDAKEVEKIMLYLYDSSYKVSANYGVFLSNRLLQLAVKIVDTLEDALEGADVDEE